VSLVLADTSVWVAHFRGANPLLQSLLATDQILCHPLIVLELACGTPPAPRERTIGDLKQLQQAVVATTDELLALIEREQLHDSGCGAIDMALLASVLLTPDTLLWTLDRKLAALAARLGLAFSTASQPQSSS
jgi:predicted nucleic acid-binding protein